MHLAKFKDNKGEVSYLILKGTKPCGSGSTPLGRGHALDVASTLERTFWKQLSDSDPMVPIWDFLIYCCDTISENVWLKQSLDPCLTEKDTG